MRCKPLGDLTVTILGKNRVSDEVIAEMAKLAYACLLFLTATSRPPF